MKHGYRKHLFSYMLKIKFLQLFFGNKETPNEKKNKGRE